MKQLIEKSHINYPELKRYIYKIVNDSISMTSEPCVYPLIKKHFYEILNKCGLTEKDVIEFSKRYWKGTKQEKWILQNDPITMFYIFLMYYSLVEKNDPHLFSILVLFMGIRYYTNLMTINIRYCNPEYFKYAMSVLFKTHLFIREKSIGGAIIHLSKTMDEKYKRKILIMYPDDISAFITEFRTRMSQSVKKFAAIYYDAAKHGKKIKKPYEDDENEIPQELDKTSRISSEISKNICVYKTIDKQIFLNSTKLTRVNLKLAENMIKEIHNVKYIEKIKTIIDIFLKDIPNVKNICSNEYYAYLKSLLMSKSKQNTLSLRKIIELLCLEIIENINLKDKFENITNQTKLNVYLFIAYYITGYLRKSICNL
jgi:hypothetical protein